MRDLKSLSVKIDIPTCDIANVCPWILSPDLFFALSVEMYRTTFGTQNIFCISVIKKILYLRFSAKYIVFLSVD